MQNIAMAYFDPKESLSEDDIALGMRMMLYDAGFVTVMAVLTTGALLIGFALALGASKRSRRRNRGGGPLAQDIFKSRRLSSWNGFRTQAAFVIHGRNQQNGNCADRVRALGRAATVPDTRIRCAAAGVFRVCEPVGLRVC